MQMVQRPLGLEYQNKFITLSIDIQSIQNIMYLYNSNHAFDDASN